MAMVTTLAIAIGVTTALTATTLMRQSIDRALDHAVSDSLTLHELFESESESRYVGPLGDADTFVILVTADGQIVGSTTNADLRGLPDMAALEAAAQGADRRDGVYGDTHVRLLTTQVPGAVVEDDGEEDDEGQATGPVYAQAGFNLALQDQLERQLLGVMLAVALLGILGAAVVTLFITRRALVPIREAFATERRFVAAASHELRTPASIIRASAEILEREHLVADDGVPLVADIIDETDRLGRLVSDLLALASLEAGAVALEVDVVDVRAWFEDIARRARAITESHGLRFVSDVTAAAGRPLIESDRDRLDQVILILVDNAVDHSPPGGVVALDLGVDERAGTATATVRDEGPGILAEDLERIFEPFARGNGRQRGSSTGLGLAIARQLTGRLGAELGVTSDPGTGAAFRLTLPLARPGSASSRSAPR